MSNAIQPLLVVQWERTISREQHEAMTKALSEIIKDSGWKAVVVDCMDSSRADVYMVDGDVLRKERRPDLISLVLGFSRATDCMDVQAGTQPEFYTQGSGGTEGCYVGSA